jgi:hypothetical protein
MKKSIIIVVVMLAAALAALKYYSSKDQLAVPATAVNTEQVQEGVALPEGAASVVAPSSEYVYTPSANQGTYDSLTMPPAAMTVKGACKDGSISEIMANHGKTWGYFTGRRAAFTPKRSQDIYTEIGNYYACLASARHDITICGELPGDADQDGIKVELFDSPQGQCRMNAGFFLFKAYVAGKAKEQQNCMGFLSIWTNDHLARISPPDFCAAAAKGIEPVTAYIKEKTPDMYPMAEKKMPSSKKVCGSDKACLANYDMWEGIKSGNPDKCPPEYKPHCAALAQKSQVPCVDILTNMSRMYCSYYKDLLKSGGGYAGLTPEEVAEELRQAAEKKAEADRQRKEAEKITKDVNTKVKKMMGGKTE